MDVQYTKTINPELLHAELKAALGADFLGVSTLGDRITVHLADGFDEMAALTALIDAHDASGLTADQRVIQVAATSGDQAAVIPGWATWNEQTAIDYITNNVTDLASAKVVLTAMARMIVALRNAQWPGLEGD